MRARQRSTRHEPAAHRSAALRIAYLLDDLVAAEEQVIVTPTALWP